MAYNTLLSVGEEMTSHFEDGWNAAIEAAKNLCDQQVELADDRDNYNPHGKEMAERLSEAIGELER